MCESGPAIVGSLRKAGGARKRGVFGAGNVLVASAAEEHLPAGADRFKPTAESKRVSVTTERHVSR